MTAVRMLAFGILGIVVAIALALPAPAAAGETWTIDVFNTDPPFDFEQKKLIPSTYTSFDPDQLSKKWFVCLLLPHATNDYWVAWLYGAIEEAKRTGIKLNILSAGGYQYVPKQLSQLEDCVTLGADAIVLVATSTTGLNTAIEAAVDKGVVIIDSGNGTTSKVPQGRSIVSFEKVGYQIAQYLVKKHPKGSGKVKLLYLGGPPGATYIEFLHKGFLAGVEGSEIEIVAELFGSPDKSSQMKLVEDGLVTYPDIQYICCCTVAVEGAMEIFQAKRLTDIELIGAFATPVVEEAMKTGEVLAMASDRAVYWARMSIDMAIQILEGRDIVRDSAPAPFMIDAASVHTYDRTTTLAPKDWTVIWKVE